VRKSIADSFSPQLEERKYWELIQYVLRSFSRDEQRMIFSLFLFRWFNEDILEYLRHEVCNEMKDLAAVWHILQRLPFLEVFPERGFTFHELYRRVVLSQLWHEEPDFYRYVAQLAAGYFLQFADDIPARVESVYHLLIAKPSEARDAYLQLIIDFQDNGQFGQWHVLNQCGWEHIDSGRLDLENTALVHESTGRLLRLVGARRESILLLEKALDIYRVLGDKGSEGGVLYSLSYDYNQEGFREKAIKGYEKAHQIFLEIGDKYYAADSLFRLGEMFEFNGETEKACAAFRQAGELFKAIDEPAREGDALFYMAETGFLPAEQALVLYHTALPLFREGWERYSSMPPDDPRLANPLRLSRARMRRWRLYSIAINMGDCLQAIGKLEGEAENYYALFLEAESSYYKALDLALQMLDLRWIIRARLRLGDIQVLVGKLESASHFFNKALEEALKIGHKLYAGWSYKGLGDIAFERGDGDQARIYYLQARELYLEIKAYSNIQRQIDPKLALLDA